MTSPSTLLTLSHAPLQKWNGCERGVLPGAVITQGGIKLERGREPFAYRRALPSLRLGSLAKNKPAAPSLLFGNKALSTKPSKWTMRVHGQKGKRKGEEEGKVSL